jgi:hypothetical protein
MKRSQAKGSQNSILLSSGSSRRSVKFDPSASVNHVYGSDLERMRYYGPHPCHRQRRSLRLVSLLIQTCYLVRCNCGAIKPTLQVHRAMHRYLTPCPPQFTCIQADYPRQDTRRAGQAFVPVSVNSTGSELHLVLETTPLFADIHAQAASSGQSAVPTDLDTNLHFTCFVAAPSPSGEGPRVVELDGRRNGPIDRGACTDLLAVRPHLYPEQLLITTGRGQNHPRTVHRRLSSEYALQCDVSWPFSRIIIQTKLYKIINVFIHGIANMPLEEPSNQ